jgi:hypothetical protein
MDHTRPLAELEAELVLAQQRSSRAKTHSDHLAAHEAVLEAERAVALAKGEEAALECEWEAPWDVGAPRPLVLASESTVCLIYLINEPDPAGDGTYDLKDVKVMDPRSGDSRPLALVQFLGCRVFQFGGPNDEVMNGHPLYGKGLSPYGAHRVANSRWLAEQQRINSVHWQYDPSSWLGTYHYVLLFHDSLFECLANGHRIERLRMSFGEAVELASRRLIGSA